jgi:hypothetical protein
MTIVATTMGSVHGSTHAKHYVNNSDGHPQISICLRISNVMKPGNILFKNFDHVLRSTLDYILSGMIARVRIREIQK